MTNSLAWDVFVQCVGFAAAGLGIFSFQAKKRRTILLMGAVASMLWMIQFALLPAGKAGAILNIIFAIRTFVFTYRDKLGKIKNGPFLAIFFCASLVIAECFIFTGPLDLFPMFGGIASTIAINEEDEQKIRLFNLGSAPCWLVYDFFAGTIGGVLTEIFSICSIIIAYVRFGIQRKREKAALDSAQVTSIETSIETAIETAISQEAAQETKDLV